MDGCDIELTIDKSFEIIAGENFKYPLCWFISQGEKTIQNAVISLDNPSDRFKFLSLIKSIFKENKISDYVIVTKDQVSIPIQSSSKEDIKGNNTLLNTSKTIPCLVFFISTKEEKSKITIPYEKDKYNNNQITKYERRTEQPDNSIIFRLT